MQIVLDFVTGKLSCEEFRTAWYADPAIGLWVENLIDLKSPPRPEWAAAPYPEFRMAIHKHYGGSVLRFIEAGEKSKQNRKMPGWVNIGWQFHAIAAVVTAAYPELKATTYYDDEQDFCLSVVGDYLGGPEVEQLITAILEQHPRSMGKSKRKKAAKVAIREAFHLGNKYPRWAQEPQWPMGVHSPMAYVSQKRDGDRVQFLFEDTDTGAQRIVEQLY